MGTCTPTQSGSTGGAGGGGGVIGATIGGVGGTGGGFGLSIAPRAINPLIQIKKDVKNHLTLFIVPPVLYYLFLENEK
jgi:hypothetical protein